MNVRMMFVAVVCDVDKKKADDGLFAFAFQSIEDFLGFLT